MKCDSCGKESDILVPLKVWVETSWGGEMATRYYCPSCFTILMEAYVNDDEQETAKLIETFKYALNTNYGDENVGTDS